MYPICIVHHNYVVIFIVRWFGSRRCLRIYTWYYCLHASIGRERERVFCKQLKMYTYILLCAQRQNYGTDRVGWEGCIFVRVSFQKAQVKEKRDEILVGEWSRARDRKREGVRSGRFFVTGWFVLLLLFICINIYNDLMEQSLWMQSRQFFFCRSFHFVGSSLKLIIIDVGIILIALIIHRIVVDGGMSRTLLLLLFDG